MNRLPEKERSESIQIAREFLNSYRQAHPDDEIETLDLWSYPLPEFNGDIIDAKYRILHGQPHTATEAAAWKSVLAVCAHFSAAQKYLFSVPMWNFGIPYKLKHFIDVLTQPGLTFTFSPESGYTGLVAGKPAAVIYSRGGEYSSDPGMRAFDFQKPYLENWLAFIGFSDIRPIVVEPSLSAPDTLEKARSLARELALKTARSF